MAIYYTMGIDCGADDALAGEIVEHFDGFNILLPGVPPIYCESYAETHRDIWFTCVYPRGMGHATLPEEERRPELANDQMAQAVRRVLYGQLPDCLGPFSAP